MYVTVLKRFSQALNNVSTDANKKNDPGNKLSSALYLM